MNDKQIAEDEPKPVEQRRTGRGVFKGTYYRYSEGHRSFECPNADRRSVIVEMLW